MSFICSFDILILFFYNLIKKSLPYKFFRFMCDEMETGPTAR